MANVTENHVFDGIPSRLSESPRMDSMSNDLTSPISSEPPILFPMSPYHGRPLRDQETQLAELKKENFGLKLRIYYLEEALKKQSTSGNEDWEMDIELNVQLEQTKKEVEDKNELLRKAKAAIDTIERTAQEEAEALRQEVARARQAAEEAQVVADELRQQNSEMQTEMEQLRMENEELRRNTATTVASPMQSFAVQTDEPLMQKLHLLEEQLREREKEVEELKDTCGEKDRRIQELELDVLRTTNKMAAAATEHAYKMQELTEEINKLKSLLLIKEEELRQKETEKQELFRQLQETRRLLAEAQEELEALRRKVALQKQELEEKDQLIEELQRRLREMERELERLREELNRLLPELNQLRDMVGERDQIIEELRRQLRNKEAELAQRERELAGARKGTHTTSMEVHTLQEELRTIREQLRQEELRREQAEADAVSKDILIEQLRARLVEVENKLKDAEEKILHMTTTHAAEMGVMRGSLDDLDRKLKHQEAVVQSLRTQVGQLMGENEALKEELERLRRENEDLRSRVDQLEQEKREKERLLDQSERHIASLQRALEELREAQPDGDSATKAKLAQLQAKVASLEHGIETRDSEIASLRQAVLTKNKIIKELQHEMDKMKKENGELRATLVSLNAEKDELEAALLRVSQQLQASQADSSKNASAFEQARRAAEQLQEEVRRLQRQVEELSRSPEKISVSVSADNSPAKPGGSPGSSSTTTMIIGNMSENLLLLILQKLQELYAEIIAGRADNKEASSSLSSKLEELTLLQRHLEGMMNRRRKSRAEATDQTDTSADLDSSLRKLEELHRVNEELLHQVEGEERRERETASLRAQLKQARLRVAELEQRLADASQLKAELEAALARAEVLKGSLEAEQEDNRRLRAQVTELRLENLQQTLKEQRDAGVTTSLPDLHAEPPPADSWTAAASSFSLGEHPEISELISKHREVTRLNQELQRRCEEKLRGDKTPRPASAGQATSYWQTRLRQQEQALRAEMRQREGSLRAQLRELEERLRMKEEEEVNGGALKARLAGLEHKLQLSEEGRERMRGQLATALSDCRMKDEEIKNLSTSLAASQEKLKVLEQQLDKLLAEKNSKIRALETRARTAERELAVAKNASMHSEEVDSLRRLNASLSEQRRVLSEQLASCQEQVAMLNKELELYQKLLHESYQEGGASSQGGEGLALTTEKVLQLLEDIRRLRRQLDQSIRKNSALSDTLNVHLSSSSLSPPKRSTTTSAAAAGVGAKRGAVNDSLDLSSSHIHVHHSPPHLASSTPYIPRTHSRGGAGAAENSASLLEDKLRRALDSPSFKGMDRGFLQELLLYLQRQRQQLDDSRELLERLGQDVPTVSHISVTHHQGAAGAQSFQEEGERSSSRASSVDLSAVHEQLRRTHTAVMQSKNLLKRQHHHQHQQHQQ